MAYHVDSSDLDVKEVLAWEGFGTTFHEPARQVVDSNSGPEITVAMTRGGLLPAGALSYTIGVRLSDAVNVEFYIDVAKTLPNPVLLEPLLGVESISGRCLLVVDDTTDSGRTLHLTFDLLRNYGAEVCSAVLYDKSRSEAAPDYVWKHTDDQIVFPWLAESPV